MADTPRAEGEAGTGPANPVGTTSHFVALDSLRGIAALAVVLFHVPWQSPVYDLRLVKNSYLMVDLFFVLSGFVVFYAYGRRLVGAADYGRFLWLRFWRLYPLHLAILGFFVAVECAKAFAQWQFGVTTPYPAFTTNGFASLAGQLLLLQAMNLFHHVSFNKPAWSIGAEFYTYIMFGAVVLGCAGRRRFVLAAALISATGGTLLALLGKAGIDATFAFGSIRCLTGFFLGTLAYAAFERLQTHAARVRGLCRDLGALTAMAAFVLYLATKSRGSSDLAVGPLAALMIMLIALAPAAGVTRFLRVRPLAWLGTVSYSIYMGHSVVLWAIYHGLQALTPMPKDDPGPLIGSVALLCALGLILALARLTYRRIEEPWRTWSRRSGPGAASIILPAPA